MKLRRLSVFLGAAVALALASAASAQWAPVGEHDAGRGKSMGGAGGQSAAVPLDFPSERSGLPIPLSIVRMGAKVGAAGRGWDIPLSFVTEDNSLLGKRPNAAGTGPARTVRVLSLLGQTMELVPKTGASSQNVYVARAGSPALEAHRLSADHWVVYDGSGRTYTFNQPGEGYNPYDTPQHPSPILAKRVLLKSIEGNGHSRVELTYEPRQHDIGRQVGQPASTRAYIAKSIDLKEIAYNFDAQGTPKHVLTLEYGVDLVSYNRYGALAVDVEHGALVRVRTLSSIAVKTRASPASPLQALTRFHLAYVDDPDTGVPALSSVSESGQDGTAEASQQLVLAEYRYGSATEAGPAVESGYPARRLRLAQTQALALPADVPSAVVAQTKRLHNGNYDEYSTTQQLVDVTGDGRSDLVYQAGGTLKVARQHSDANGTPVLSDLFGPLQDAVMDKSSLGMYTKRGPSEAEGKVPGNRFDEKVIDTWRQFADANGDGRPDLWVADEKGGAWVIYLNTPDTSYAHNTKWVRREVSVSHLVTALQSRGHDLDRRGANNLHYVPLMRSRTSVEFVDNLCWDFDHASNQWRQVSSEFWVLGTVTDPTTGLPHDAYVPSVCGKAPALKVSLGEITATEWKLVDLNHDGGLDLVFASEPLRILGIGEPPSDSASPWHRPGSKFFTLDNHGSFVVYNISADDLVPRSAPVAGGVLDTWQVDFNQQYVCDYSNDPSTCAWTQDPTDQHLTQTMQDVNGDGRLDFINGSVADLGYGVVWGLGPVDGLDSVDVYQTSAEAACKTASQYQAAHKLRIVDVTGDGIPDLWKGNRVSIGTGSGFRWPVSITHSSNDSENACDGSKDDITADVYDFDGDGHVDIVRGTSDGKLALFRLIGRSGDGQEEPRALSAGLLAEVRNGHGGSTRYIYKSAKDEPAMHQMPYPEVVVGAVKTVDENANQLAETRYAYGSPIFGFDLSAGRFRPFGYARTVAVSSATGSFPASGTFEGTATITDAYVALGAPSSDTQATLYANYLLAGRPRETTTLSGQVADPATLLQANLASDSRRIGANSYAYEVRSTGEDPNGLVCPNAYPMCRMNGFMYTKSTQSWQGQEAPPSLKNLMSRSEVLVVDEIGRATRSYVDGDMRRDDDNRCVEVSYATPVSSGLPQVLTSVASSRLRQLPVGAGPSQCATAPVISAGRTEYDDLPQGQVSQGWPTAETVDRYDLGTGAMLESIRMYEATYDGYGNPTQLRTQSDDGRTRVVTTAYDPFGLVALSTSTQATGAATLSSSVEVDPLSLLPTSVTDANQIKHGTKYDGFRRPVLRTVTPQNGVEGVMSVVGYLGFDGLDPSGRRILAKTFDNPVLPVTVQAASNALGHTATTYLDTFGRARKTVVDLGSDYVDDMVVDDTQYDAFGRVKYVADPYPTSQNGTSLYGTTQHFNTDGTVQCTIRGHGVQPKPVNVLEASDGNADRLATCQSYDYENGQFISGTWLPDATNAFATKTQHVATTDALGRVLSRETRTPTERLEYSTFEYDALGHVASMTRYKSPGALGGSPANGEMWTFRYDSLGRMLEHRERSQQDAITTRNNRYSSWGELLSTTATASGPTLPPQDILEERMTYDGLGRVLTSEQLRNGKVLDETKNRFGYDYSTAVHPALGTISMLGQLASAVSATSEVHFGYDALGRTKATAYKAPEGGLYIQTIVHDVDGTMTEMGALLPDTSHRPESMRYVYDSARRLHTATFVDENQHVRELYSAQQVDAFGRVRAAKVGTGGLYVADYADVGRRLLNHVTLQSGSGEQRSISNISYDNLNREVSREEQRNAQHGVTTTYTYDALGRLTNSVKIDIADSRRILAQHVFGYDALGNKLFGHDLLGSDDVNLSYREDGRDRLCSIGYQGAAANPTSCNVVHDHFGNIVQMPTETGQRTFSYLPSGAIRSIRKEDDTLAEYRYDAFGNVQELDITASNLETRRDRRYGNFELRDIRDGSGILNTVLERTWAVAGMTATRKGTTDTWVMAVGEPRGNRYFLDQAGELVQETDYSDFGDPQNLGALPNSYTYSREQWNGGDRLAGFGLSHLGARLYDPKIGRFLSSDPMVLMQTATTSNPYAFANNDPINASDPSGLCPEGCADDSWKFWKDLGWDTAPLATLARPSAPAGPPEPGRTQRSAPNMTLGAGFGLFDSILGELLDPAGLSTTPGDKSGLSQVVAEVGDTALPGVTAALGLDYSNSDSSGLAALRAASALATGGLAKFGSAAPRASGRFSGGQRASPHVEIEAAEAARLRSEYVQVGGNPKELEFNSGTRTGYVDGTGRINVRGDINPSTNPNATDARSTMSSRAALAHERGHLVRSDPRLYRGAGLPPGAWNDEFRASYWAAVRAPGLDLQERSLLMRDALSRAAEAGVSVTITPTIRRMLTGH